jgi:hypothetical protein
MSEEKVYKVKVSQSYTVDEEYEIKCSCAKEALNIAHDYAMDDFNVSLNKTINGHDSHDVWMDKVDI